MKTIDALEGACDLLRRLASGEALDFGTGTTASAKLHAYQDAAAKHRAQERDDAARRDGIRELAERARAARSVA